MNRSKARDLAFKFLYQVEVQKENNQEAIDLFFANNEIENSDAKKYILSIANGVKDNIDTIFQSILQEFPLYSVRVRMPQWLQALPFDDDIIKEIVVPKKLVNIVVKP